MRNMTLLLLAGMPFLLGQMCGGADFLPDNQTDTQPSDDEDQDPPPAAKTLTGPGFRLVVPAGFSSYAGLELPPAGGFKEAYGDGERLIVVSTQTPPVGGPYNFTSNLIRLRSALTSDSGDYILSARVACPDQQGENLAGYALLANGNLLCVEISAGRPPTADDVAFSTVLFRSINLAESDGTALEQQLFANHPKLLGCTERGLLVLDDQSAWMADQAATAEDMSEMRSWAKGCAVHSQLSGDRLELMQIGRWVAVPARYLSVATATTVADYDSASRKITFANGQSHILVNSKLPQSWQYGDSVLIVRDQSKSWIIWAKTWQWIEM